MRGGRARGHGRRGLPSHSSGLEQVTAVRWRGCTGYGGAGPACGPAGGGFGDDVAAPRARCFGNGAKAFHGTPWHGAAPHGVLHRQRQGGTREAPARVLPCPLWRSITAVQRCCASYSPGVPAPAPCRSATAAASVL